MNASHPIDLMTDDAFGWYLSGLVDGEGCFSFSKHISQRNFSARFAISMRADEELGLRAIAKRVGAGSFRIFKPAAKALRPNTNPQICWDVHKLKELVTVIIPRFERYPLAMKKARDFATWSECVSLLYATSLRPRSGIPGRRGGTLPRITDAERSILIAGADRLRSGRIFSPPVAK